MKLNKDKCKSLHLGRKWSLQWYRLETGACGVALPKTPLKRAVWDSSTLAVKRTRNILGCSNRSRTQKGLSLSIHHCGWWCTLEYCAKCWVPRFKTEMDKPHQVQQRATKIFGSWSPCPVRRGWGRWDYSAWSRGGSRGTKHESFSIRRYRQTSQPWGGRVKDTRQKAETIKVQTSMRRNVYTIRRQSDSATHCPGSISPFLGVFQTQPDKGMSEWSDPIADLALSRSLGVLVYPTLLVPGLSFELSSVLSVVHEERQEPPLCNSHLNGLINLYWRPICLQ